MRKPVKHCMNISALLFCLLFILPLATVTVIQREKKSEKNPETVEILPPGKLDGEETIRVLTDTGVKKMSMGEYLQGVVRAEMPASFQQQALSAQAVAARTYTLYKTLSGGNHGDGGGRVRRIPPAARPISPGSRPPANWGGHAAALRGGRWKTPYRHDGRRDHPLRRHRPILAVFHSSSAGTHQERSGEVWTKDLPYLQSVESPGKGAPEIPNYYSTPDPHRRRSSPAEFLASSYPQADLSGEKLQRVGHGT
jgi:stage II sporulation protein D